MIQCDDLLPAFFCVPDITGFTRLIATADIEFSREFIPGLLRRLIDANILSLQVGEIEGDAIFFYRTGRLPDSKRVMKQCLRFFDVFNRYITQLQKSHPEEYERHLSGGQVGLKVIIHYGCTCTANIKGRTKLIGTDVIIAHRLLKNSIAADEYILFTHDYLKRINGRNYHDLFGDKELKTGVESYEYIGDVGYQYLEINGSSVPTTVK